MECKSRVRVLVAMSGGVDSSVAAALLKRQGHQVVGVTLDVWSQEKMEGRFCCSLESAASARQVADLLKIPHYTLEARGPFERCVINDFITEYLECRTPNPCVLCNALVKWGILREYARTLGLEFLATGHYARLCPDTGGGTLLQKGADPRKDQSYFLWAVGKDLLDTTLFPLGDMKKQEVRELARQWKLPVAERPESQEICFIPDGDYHSFLRRHAGARLSGVLPGDIVEPSGKVIGRHQGLAFYTIGQRKGLGALGPRPHFVIRLEREQNRLVAGTREDLFSSHFHVRGVNWLKSPDSDCFPAMVKIRYQQTPVSCRVSRKGDGLEASLQEPQKAVTPGQSAVFYHGDTVLCGGKIEG